MPEPYTLVDCTASAATPSSLSGTDMIDVTESGDLESMRGRVWYLDPGDSTADHRQGEQEELYFQVEGPGRMRFGDETVTVPERTLVRVPPETRRQVFNDTDETHVWFIVGAPPVENDGRPVE